uniref:Uncharacterized protein n=1 Tax=Arundo donax TaxID=35708 RepID=A0A0A9GYG7_ARUDO
MGSYIIYSSCTLSNALLTNLISHEINFFFVSVSAVVYGSCCIH